MRYRKLPVEIEAVQWLGDNFVEVHNFCPSLVLDKRVYADDESLIIPTLEGDHRASLGDFIIKGVEGEFYPCKPDIFAKTYEMVEEEERVDSPR